MCRKIQMVNFGSIAHLNELLMGMERDLGISDLGAVQKEIVYAATILLEKDRILKLTNYVGTPYVKECPAAVFSEHWKTSWKPGYLNHCNVTQRSAYALSDKMK